MYGGSESSQVAYIHEVNYNPPDVVGGTEYSFEDWLSNWQYVIGTDYAPVYDAKTVRVFKSGTLEAPDELMGTRPDDRYIAGKTYIFEVAFKVNQPMIEKYEFRFGMNLKVAIYDKPEYIASRSDYLIIARLEVKPLDPIITNVSLNTTEPEAGKEYKVTYNCAVSTGNILNAWEGNFGLGYEYTKTIWY